MTIGGPGWPNPVPNPLGDPNVNLSRGVDLSALKDKSKHTHRWVVVAKFAMPDKMLARMAENNLRALNAQSKGEEIEIPPVPVPMGDGNMLSLDGPGCSKCGGHWTAVYGQLCTVSDDQLIEDVRQQMDRVNEELGGNASNGEGTSRPEDGATITNLFRPGDPDPSGD